jgi:lysophospholipase L1-like esterase
MTPPLTKRKKIFYSAVTFLIILVTLELGLHAIDFVVSRVKKKSLGQMPFRGFYQGETWAPTLAREMEKPHWDQIYNQYLTWITKPVKGQFLNVDRETGRKTWNPPDLPRDAEKIFVFGGSAAWGQGARDNHTLPSDLSRFLNAQAPRFRVYNYGEPGYTFTQELFYFISLLQKGWRPQYVIFYDGFNDVYGANQSGRAGSLHNLLHSQEKLMNKPGRLYWKAIKKWLAENIYLYDKVYHKLYLRFHPENRYLDAGTHLTDQELETLGAEVVQYYVRSLDILEHLSRAYGFKFLCFWQPALHTEAKVMPQEPTVDDLWDKKFGTLYRFTNQHLDRQTLPHFHNISDAVGTRAHSFYIDLVHMTEEGYAMVAERIYQIFLKEFPENKPGPH